MASTCHASLSNNLYSPDFSVEMCMLHCNNTDSQVALPDSGLSCPDSTRAFCFHSTETNATRVNQEQDSDPYKQKGLHRIHRLIFSFIPPPLKRDYFQCSFIDGGKSCSKAKRKNATRLDNEAFAREVNADAGKLLSMRNPVTVIKHKRHGFLSLSARGTPTRQQAIILNEPFKKDNRTLKILISHLPEEFPPMLH
ncbi:unnamed protein product [Natator depressus]